MACFSDGWPVGGELQDVPAAFCLVRRLKKFAYFGKFCGIMLSFLVLCFGALPVHAQPSEAAVRRHVAGQLPEGVELQSITLRVFPGPSAGTGRVSVMGSVHASVDLYRRARRSDTLDRLGREGLTGQEIDGYVSRIYPPGTVEFFVWDRVLQAGGRRRFTGELTYTETVSGARFGGRVQHGLQNTVTMTGMQRIRAAFPERRAIHLINGGASTDQLVDRVLRMHEAERARQAEARERARAALQVARDDFLTLIAEDLAWFSSTRRRSGAPLTHRLLARISECTVVEEREDFQFDMGSHRVLTAHTLRADCLGRTNALSDQGRFRFMDGLEIHPEQRRPMSIYFSFPTDFSRGDLSGFPESFVFLCMEKITEDEGRGGVFAGRHTLGQPSCRSAIAHDTLTWLPDRDGFSQGETGWTIMGFDAAVAAFGLEWREPTGRHDGSGTVPSGGAEAFLPHEDWFVQGARFEGYRDGQDGTRLPLAMEVTGPRQVRVAQGDGTCSRRLRLREADGETVTLHGRMLLGRATCQLEGTVVLRGTSEGVIHYEWRDRNLVTRGILSPTSARPRQ